MLLRWLFIFVGLTLFIGGCNNLLSSAAGTHKLRVIQADEMMRNGIGDADYLQVEGLRIGAKALVDPPRYIWERPILVVSLHRNDSVVGVAWQKVEISEDCHNQNCVDKFKLPIVGMVNPTSRLQSFISKHKNEDLDWKGLSGEKNPSLFYIAYNRHPIAWYWNLLMCLGGILLFIWIERKNIFKN